MDASRQASDGDHSSHKADAGAMQPTTAHETSWQLAPSAQLIQRAASLPMQASSPTDSPRSSSGEYCLRLPVADKAQLSSAIIHDTMAALPVPPSTVSHVEGPVLEVHQVDDHSVDIRIVHSFRASYAQPIDEVRHTAAAAWQEQQLRQQEQAAVAAIAAAPGSNAGTSKRRSRQHQQGHVHWEDLREHEHHVHPYHVHCHHHHHGQRQHSGDTCVLCTEIADGDEQLLPADIKRCTACVVHEHDVSTDTEAASTEPEQPTSVSSIEEPAGSSSSASKPQVQLLLPAAGVARHVPAAAGAGASPFAASLFQAAASGMQPFSLPDAPAKAAEPAVPAGSAAAASPACRAPESPRAEAEGLSLPQTGSRKQRQQRQQLPVLLPTADRHGGRRLSVEVLRGSASTGSSDHARDEVVSPTAISDASEDAAAYQHWLRHQHWNQQQHQQQERQVTWQDTHLSDQPSSAVLHAPVRPGVASQAGDVHVRLTHRRTAHGHEEVEVSHAHPGFEQAAAPSSSLLQQQSSQREQQLQLVRQQQQWMSTGLQQQLLQASLDQPMNQLDLNVLQQPSGFAPLSGQQLPHYVMSQQEHQEWQHGQQQLAVPGPAGAAMQAQRYAPHPALLAHLRANPMPMNRVPPGCGFQPRCDWELDPRKVLVGRRLAVGGFAEVFLGKYEGTVVAIKRLLTNDAVTIERFVSEVRLLARLRHPNLILFMGYCATPELCIVSEYMSKGSLYGVLHSPEQRKKRAAAVAASRGSTAAGSKPVAALPAPDLSGEHPQQQVTHGSLVTAPERQESSQLQVQPSLVEGQLPLAEEIRYQQEALETKLQRLVAISVARGMAYLHTRSPPILHLDLKSPNILLDDRWRVKITDFGLSRARQNTFLSSTAQGGTPEWMAPEVLRCEDVSEPADVYSYGVVLWELITGRPPWENYNAMQVVAMVGFRDMSLPMPASAAEPFLLDLCQKCLHRDPKQRPTFPQIVAQLDQEYGPPAWSSHAQPLLPPTLRLQLPPAAAIKAAAAAAAVPAAAGSEEAVAHGAQEVEASRTAAAVPTTAAARQDSVSVPKVAAGAAGAILVTPDGQAVLTAGVPTAAAAHTSSSSSLNDRQPNEGYSTAIVTGADAGKDVLQPGVSADAVMPAPPKLFSPFGDVQLPPWSAESVQSLSGPASAAAAHGFQAVADAEGVLSLSSSTDASYTGSESGGASRFDRMSSKDTSTQPASLSGVPMPEDHQAIRVAEGAVRHEAVQMASSTDSPRAAVSTAHAAPRDSTGNRERQQQVPSVSDGVDARSRTPEAAARPAAGAAAGAEAGSAVTSPPAELHFAIGPACYNTPVKVGAYLCPTNAADSGSHRGTPPAAAAAADQKTVACTSVQPAAFNPFGAVALAPLSSSSTANTTSSIRDVQEPDTAAADAGASDAHSQAAAAAAGAGLGAGACTQVRTGSSHEPLPEPLAERLRAFLGSAAAGAAAPASGRPGAGAAVRTCLAALNGPASAPSATGLLSEQQTGALLARLDAAGSLGHSTAGFSSTLPSDGSFLHGFWPSMTATDGSTHSLASHLEQTSSSRCTDGCRHEQEHEGSGPSRPSSRTRGNGDVADTDKPVVDGTCSDAVSRQSSGPVTDSVLQRYSSAALGSTQGTAIDGPCSDSQHEAQAADTACPPLQQQQPAQQEQPKKKHQPHAMQQQDTPQGQQQDSSAAADQPVYQAWPVLAAASPVPAVLSKMQQKLPEMLGQAVGGVIKAHTPPSSVGPVGCKTKQVNGDECQDAAVALAAARASSSEDDLRGSCDADRPADAKPVQLAKDGQQTSPAKRAALAPPEQLNLQAPAQQLECSLQQELEHSVLPSSNQQQQQQQDLLDPFLQQQQQELQQLLGQPDHTVLLTFEQQQQHMSYPFTQQRELHQQQQQHMSYPFTQQRELQQQQVSQRPSLHSSSSLGAHLHRMTCYQRKGRFMVSTTTPEPPGLEDPHCVDDVAGCGALGTADVGAADSAAGSLQQQQQPSYSDHWQAAAVAVATSGASSSLGLMSACLQPCNGPVLGTMLGCYQLSAPLQAGLQQHGLEMQMSAPALLGSQQVTQQSTSAVPSIDAAGGASLPLSRHSSDAAAGVVTAAVRDGEAAGGPGSRQLAAKGYWGSGTMSPKPSAAGDQASMSSTCSSESPLAAPAMHQAGTEAVVSCSSAVCEGNNCGGWPEQQLPARSSSSDDYGNSSHGAHSALLQHVESCPGGLCYKSGRFHVTVEQLQAWQQRRQQSQQQHGAAVHHSSSTGALAAAAGMSAAYAAADAGVTGKVQSGHLLHGSASCGSLLMPVQGSQQQQTGEQQQRVPDAGRALQSIALSKQQQQHGTVQTGSVAAVLSGGQAGSTRPLDRSISSGSISSSAGGGNSSSRRSHGGVASSNRSSVGGGASTGRSSHPGNQATPQAGTAVQPRAAAAASRGQAKPAGAAGCSKPPIAPCPTPSPMASPGDSPRTHKAKPRDYCKGRFHVHEAPLVGPLWQGAGQAHVGAAATAAAPHSICVGELQQLHKAAQLQQQQGPTPATLPSGQQPQEPWQSEAGARGDTVRPLDGGQQLSQQGQGQQQHQLTYLAASSSAGPSAADCGILGSWVAAAAISPGSTPGTPLSAEASASSAASAFTGAAATTPAAESSCLMVGAGSPAGSTVAAEGTYSAGAGAAAAFAGSSSSSLTAAATLVQQRGRFTVRQESRPSSRSGSTHASKAGSPRGGHCPASERMSKLGGRDAAAASVPAAASVGQGSMRKAPSSSSVLLAAGSQAAEAPLPAAAAAARVDMTAPSLPVASDVPQLAPVKTVSKKGRFVVTQLTPGGTACSTPKPAGGAATPTAAAAGGGSRQLLPSFSRAGEAAASQPVTCLVCSTPQQLPMLLPAAGSCRASCSSLVDAAATAGPSVQYNASSSSKPEACASQQVPLASGYSSCGDLGGPAAASLHTCGSCGAPLALPQSRARTAISAAIGDTAPGDAAAGAAGAAAAAAAAVGHGETPHQCSTMSAGAAASGAAVLHSDAHQQQHQQQQQQQHHDHQADLHWLHGNTHASWAAADPSAVHSLQADAALASADPHGAPQGLLAVAAARVLAARAAREQQQQQRHGHIRHGYEATEQGHFYSMPSSCDLFSESSCQYSSISSGRTSCSSIAALPPHPAASGSCPALRVHPIGSMHPLGSNPVMTAHAGSVGVGGAAAASSIGTRDTLHASATSPTAGTAAAGEAFAGANAVVAGAIGNAAAAGDGSGSSGTAGPLAAAASAGDGEICVNSAWNQPLSHPAEWLNSLPSDASSSKSTSSSPRSGKSPPCSPVMLPEGVGP